MQRGVWSGLVIAALLAKPCWAFCNITAFCHPAAVSCFCRDVWHYCEGFTNRIYNSDKPGWDEVHLFAKHDCIKNINAWAWEHFVKLLSVNSSFADDCILLLLKFYAASQLVWSQSRKSVPGFCQQDKSLSSFMPDMATISQQKWISSPSFLSMWDIVFYFLQLMAREGSCRGHGGGALQKMAHKDSRNFSRDDRHDCSA